MKFVRERLPCGGKNDSRRLAVGRQMRHIRVYPDQNRPMAIARSRTFRSGNSEAVRLPKDVAFGDDVERVIVRSGDVITMYPAGTTIASMHERLRALPRPRWIEQRDDDPLPEREGL